MNYLANSCVLASFGVLGMVLVFSLNIHRYLYFRE
jgi:hypothetical protein